MAPSIESRFSQAALQMLLTDASFLAGVLVQLKRIAAPEIAPTMATDGVHLFYDPEWVSKLTPEELRGVLVHESLHVALNHPARLAEIENMPKNVPAWKIATDVVVNGLIHEDGLGSLLPKGHVHLPEYAGMSAENVYAELLKLVNERGTGDSDSNECDDSDSDGCGDSDSGSAECGGHKSCGGVLTPRDEQGNELQGEAREMAIADAASKVAYAAQVAKTQGVGAGSAILKAIIDDMYESVVPWQVLLRRYANAAAKQNYTYRRPKRGSMDTTGVILPSLNSKGHGEYIVAVDTSASVSEKELSMYFGELTDILLSLRPRRTTLVQCDYDIQSVEEFTETDIALKGGVHGRGGTAFEPVFNWVYENGRKPKCLIYFTDMGASFPKQAPPYPVIWVNSHGVFTGTVPFGEVVNFCQC